MVVDPRLERLYEGVELVRGIGDPFLGQFCVMSFVAYLAGEGHTDCPRSASPVIRGMAVPINDRMPPSLRQRLKAFVPRIIGTNDGLDGARVEVLRHALLAEILPRAASQGRSARAAGRDRGVLGRLWRGMMKRVLLRRIAAALLILEALGRDDRPSGLEARVANATGQLIALCARDAPTAADDAWFWDRAIDLLDRLCDIGAEGRAVAVRAQRVDALARILEARRSARDPCRPEPAELGTLFPGVAAAADESSGAAAWAGDATRIA